MREVREKKGYSQAEVARKLNVSRSWINKIENGKTVPSLKMALRIANILDCKVEDLFYLD
jgi:putative transcriptional regulator